MELRKGLWQITHSSEKYQNPWIKVTEDQVIRPDGKPGIYGTIHIKKGVNILPLDDQGFVYLTEEYRYALERESVEVANGGIDEDEQPLPAAQRELQEELGIQAEEWTYLGAIDQFTSLVFSPVHLFLARKLSFTSKSPEGTEQIKEIKIPFEEAVKMVMDGKITHAPSCVLILKVKELLQKKDGV